MWKNIREPSLRGIGYFSGERKEPRLIGLNKGLCGKSIREPDYETRRN